MQPSQIKRATHDATLATSTKEEKLRLFADWAADYDAHSNAGRYCAPMVVNDRLLKFLAEDASYRNTSASALRALDAGCGTGLGSDSLRSYSDDPSTPHTLHLIGVDYSPDMLALAKERSTYDELHEADLSKVLQLPGGAVDLVVSAGVFLRGNCGPN